MRRSRVLSGVALFALLAVIGCSGDSGGETPSGEEDAPLTVWTTEDLEDRVATQQKIMDGLERQDRHQGESGARSRRTSWPPCSPRRRRRDELPDVIAALSLNGVNQLHTDDLLDTDAAAEIVDGSGPRHVHPPGPRADQG